MKCIHRTSQDAAESIIEHGFDIDRFGAGAGAGSGEPAGIFVSPDDGADFLVENDKRGLGFDAIIEVEFYPKNLVELEADNRIARFKACRIQFLCEKFSIKRDEAQAIISYKTRILNERPDLSRIEEWASSKEGETELAKFFSQSLMREGIDAVSYMDPWQKVKQIIILDKEIIESVHPQQEIRIRKKFSP